MKKVVLGFFCLFIIAFSTLTFASIQKGEYKGMVYPAGQMGLGKIGIYPTDILVINNTPDSIRVSAPGIYSDYLGPNQVYRITSYASIAPEVILWHYFYSDFFDRFVQPHSIISFSIQYGAVNTIVAEYYS